MRIIPALDIIDGKCIRLEKGDYNKKKVYNNNPLEVAKEFEDNGMKYLHLVDLDGAKSKHIVNYKILENIATQTNLIIDFGGGLKTNEDLDIAFNSGASQITGGSIAAANPELFLSWLEKYGADKIILGADYRDDKIAINGWKENTTLSLLDYIKKYELAGIKKIICTDINKDGMLEGCSVDMYQKIMANSDVDLIASGGVSSFEDLIELESIGCEGAIVGKAIYENKISLSQLATLC